MPVHPSRAALRARAFCIFTASVAVLAVRAPARADVVGAIRGTVADAGAGIVVRIVGDGVAQSARTDAAGRFTFARVPFGRYTVTAQRAGTAVSAVVEVTTGGVADLTLGASPQRIGSTQATARGVRGNPVSDNTLSRAAIAELPRTQKLNDVVETMPGIVRFSYDEPVAHGFHGLTYELDGVPLPRNTSQNFSDLFDVREAQSVEVLSGAFPAEFGGSRQGAVVNVRSRAGGPDDPHGLLEIGGGSSGTAELRVSRHAKFGAATDALVAANLSRTGRGIDAPTRDAVHDESSLADAFLRIAHRFDERTTLAFDASTQASSYRIPYNVQPTAFDPQVAAAGTDDVQREGDRFAALSFTQASRDGAGFVQISPWVRSGRIVYDGDLAADARGFVANPDGSTTPLAGVREDRRAAYAGLRVAAFRSSARHAFKAGLDVQRENVAGTTLIAAAGNAPFRDAAARSGAQIGGYVQDRWSPAERVGVDLGLRYDASSGYVHGTQLSPRLGINLQLGARDVLHAFYGRLYAAPSIEDTRRDAVVTAGASGAALPVYDLQPERDSYEEIGLAHRFSGTTSGYVNGFRREAIDVLDTTQLARTPIFAVFNNAVGRVWGLEGRLQSETREHSAYLSLTLSSARAGGVGGGLFLLDPDPNAAAAAAADVTLQPEDHDQRYTGRAGWAERFGGDRRTFASVGLEYGTGFPVAFQNGSGRLAAHTTVDLAVGRHAAHGGLGFELDATNVLDHRYLIKADNGFNTTQWNGPRQIVLRVSAPW